MGLAVGLFGILVLGAIILGGCFLLGSILCFLSPYLRLNWNRTKGKILDMKVVADKYVYLVECNLNGLCRKYTMSDLGKRRQIGDTVKVLLKRPELEIAKNGGLKWWMILIGVILAIVGIVIIVLSINFWNELWGSLESYNEQFR